LIERAQEFRHKRNVIIERFAGCSYVMLNKRLAMRQLIAGMIVGVSLVAGSAFGEMSIFRGKDGTTGTVRNFGGIGVYQDPHGTMGMAYNFGPTSQFIGPGGQTQSGTIYHFGSSASKQTIPAIPAPYAPTVQPPPLPLFTPQPPLRGLEPLGVPRFGGF
jgi:hypothetical protein